MNPYTYSRGGFVSQPRPFKSGKSGSFFSDVKNLFCSQVSSAISFAIIALVSVSTTSIVLMEKEELYQTDFSSLAATIIYKTESKILGVVTQGVNAPSCGSKVCLSYQLLGHQDGYWSAKVDYSTKTGVSVSGSVKINTEGLVYKIKTPGFAETGYKLSPEVPYTVKFYSGSKGTGIVLATLKFTPPAFPVAGGVQCSTEMEAPARCSYDASCSLICSQPSYGYALPDNGSKAGYPAEGWVERVLVQEPGKISFAGWAYDDAKNTTISVSIRNQETGKLYTSSSTLASWRPDIDAYMKEKYQDGYLYAKNLFEVSIIGLPKGEYYLQSTKFNDYTLYVQGGVGGPYRIFEAAGAAGLKVIAPNGGEKWQMGSIQKISWTDTTGGEASYKIYVRRTDGVDAGVIAVVEKFTTYEWKVGYLADGSVLPIGEDYKILVSGLAADESDIMFDIVSTSAKLRIGQLVIIVDSVYLVDKDGLYSFANLSAFNSWAFAYTDIVPANNAEKLLKKIGVVPVKQGNYASPLDQIHAGGR